MNKPYLIMLPGWGINSIVWQRINAFLSKDFELIFVEWEHMDSLDAFKQRVIGVIEEKGLSNFSVLGWSLGALVAQELAMYQIYKIQHLILIGGTSCFVQHKEDAYKSGWHTRIVERMKFQMLHNKPEETLFQFNDMMFSKSEKEMGHDKAFLESVASTSKSQDINDYLLGLDYLIQKDFRHQLMDLKTPLLMIHGEEDSICPLEAAIYIKNAVSYSKISIIKQSGHMPFFTQPRDCYQAIAQFITKPI